MKLLYIDESGDTIPISQSGKHYLVLLGAIIDEAEMIAIDKDFRSIKHKYYQEPDIEVKSNFLRYANPDLTQSSPLKLNSRQKYDELEADIASFLKKIPVDALSVVINKADYWSKYPAQNPYEVAYMFLLERFQFYLNQSNSLGICIIDPREGQVEKHYMGDELSDLHEKMRRTGRGDGSVWNKTPKVVEKLLFSQSDKTIGIQIADLLSYPIFHIYEYDKKPEEYWRFIDVTLPKLIRRNGKLDGYGLKYFPGTNKKDLP